MTSAKSSPCSSCNTSTTHKSPECIDSPAYSEARMGSAFYCTTNCRMNHRDLHREECKKLQLRKSIQRAAILLQGVMIRIRTHFATMRFQSIRVEGPTAIFELPWVNNPPYQTEPFTVSWDGDRKYIEAALLYLSCTEAMVLLENFVREMLKGERTELAILQWRPYNVRSSSYLADF